MIPSDEETDRPLIRNEETLRRRAFIDSALAAVRDRLAGDDTGRHEGAEAPVRRKPARPRLYLVRNAGPR